MLKNSEELVIIVFLFRYKHCYEEACSGLDEMLIREKGINRDDYIHGSLLVLNELFRVSNVQWERYYEELMQKLEFNQNTSPGVRPFYTIDTFSSSRILTFR